MALFPEYPPLHFSVVIPLKTVPTKTIKSSQQADICCTTRATLSQDKEAFISAKSLNTSSALP